MLYLTVEWDAYDVPNILTLFGLDGEITGLPGKTVWWPHKADIAFGWLERNGFKFTGKTTQTGPRLPFGGFKRLVTMTFAREA